MYFLYDLESLTENDALFENYNKNLSLMKNYEEPFIFNNSINLDLDENENQDDNYGIEPPSFYLDNFGKVKNKYNIERTTSFETQKLIKEPNFYCFDVIKNILNEIYKDKFSIVIENKFIINNEIKEEEEYLSLSRKRKRENDTNNKKMLIEIGEDKGNKRGRKTKNIEKKREVHTRMFSDNIIKKIKAYIFKYPIEFLNNLINTLNLENKFKILKLDYKYINHLKREVNLDYLGMPLKDLFSKDISGKYNKLEPNINKINIERLLSNQTDETIKFVFNISFGNWLDLFTYKKTIKELINEYDPYDYKKIDYQKIKDNFIGIDVLLNKIKKEDPNYFSLFIFYLYNYERWFFIKKGRNKKEK